MRGLRRFSWLLLAICLLGVVGTLPGQTPVSPTEPPATVAPSISATSNPAGGSAPTVVAGGASSTPLRLNIGLEGGGKPADVSVAIQLVVLMTLLTLAPSLVILMTSFTRIVTSPHYECRN